MVDANLETYVVTGAARGIGRAIALQLVEAKAVVFAVDMLADELELLAREANFMRTDSFVPVYGDVRDDVTLQRCLELIAMRFRTVDGLVNNAGGGFVAGFDALSPNAQATLIAENFTHVANWSRGVGAILSTDSSIVNITSIEGHRAGPGFAVYSAMKAGVESLTKSLALEYAPRQIRVNAIAPDMIPTPGDLALTTDAQALDPAYFPTPLGRTGDVAEVATAALFLLSDWSSFMTGTTLHLDGGNFAASGWKRRRSDDSWAL